MNYAMQYALCAVRFGWHKKCLLLSQWSISGMAEVIFQRGGDIAYPFYKSADDALKK